MTTFVLAVNTLALPMATLNWAMANLGHSHLGLGQPEPRPPWIWPRPAWAEANIGLAMAKLGQQHLQGGHDPLGVGHGQPGPGTCRGQILLEEQRFPFHCVTKVTKFGQVTSSSQLESQQGRVLGVTIHLDTSMGSQIPTGSQSHRESGASSCHRLGWAIRPFFCELKKPPK